VKDKLTRREMLKVSGGALAAASLLGLTGCGGGGSSGSASKTLTLGNIGWTENEALSTLTKVVLEGDLGYKEVKLQVAQIGLVFEGVGSGKIDAFQDVWMPNHEQYLSEVENDVEHLKPWFEGTTKYSMAAPTYMGIDSIAEINSTNATEIIGIEAGLPMTEAINNKAIPQYNLQTKQVISGTAGMLAEVDRRIKDKEEFIFVAWSPHWMNQVYDFVYLKDPKGALGSLTHPSKISTIVNEDLEGDDPVGYAFLKALRMDADQLDSLENEIRTADDDAVAGSKAWLKDNRDVVQPAINAAKNA
jgi:glycine betaine/proline transport system substrate-binding protein